MRHRRNCLILLVLLMWLGCIVTLYWYITQDDGTNIKNHRIELLWWTNDMKFRYNEERHCGRFTCRVTNNRKRLSDAKVILFYGSNIKIDDFPLPRSRRHVWALLHEESPRNVQFMPYNDFLQHFNFTSTFSRYSNLPLTTQYLPKASDLSRKDYFRHHYAKKVLQFNTDSASVVFLQSDCNTMTGREDYVRELMQHIKVDSFGGCLKNHDLPEELQHDYLNNLYSPKLLTFLANYEFMIAIENGVCEDYITEKFWRPLIAGVIPIYFGSPSVRDWQPHNKSAIYVDNFSNAKALAAYLRQLSENTTAYNEYMAHKLNTENTVDNKLLLNTLLTRSYQMASSRASTEDSLFRRFECLMCTQNEYGATISRASTRQYNCSIPPKHVPLMQQNKPKYADDWRSMMSVGRCQAHVLNDLFKANRKYTLKDFTSRLSKMVRNNMCD